ncbi:MAG: MraY family glycosyltransferase [Phycisphaerales bacterium]
MILNVLALGVLAFLIALPATVVVRGVARRWSAFDSAGVEGQVKAPRRKVPNVGGIGIFVAIALPMVLFLSLARLHGHAEMLDPSDPSLVPVDVQEHLPGVLSRWREAVVLLGGAFLVHGLGLIDDRRPLGPFVKLAVMAIPALAVPMFGGTRLLTLMDAHVGGAWLSVGLTAAWIVVVMNAFNFMDNMDGLCGGVALVASCSLLVTAVRFEQWFVAGTLALVAGGTLGFLVFNFPWRPRGHDGQTRGASIFLGDGGSLLLGFVLAVLSVRLTYIRVGDAAPGWHAPLTPLVVMAVPLYDFASVVLIRLVQGKSPFVGDLQHLSHRIERRGLSRRATVVVIVLFATAFGLGGTVLATSTPRDAMVIGAQSAAILGALALFEWSETRQKRRGA